MESAPDLKLGEPTAITVVMKNRKTVNYLLFIFFFLCFVPGFAAQVDTVETPSLAMNKTIKAVVILPESYSETEALPVVYLLHGYGGNYANWIKSVPAIAQLADQYKFILVCPDGAIGSWYLDSPVDAAYRYETYMTKELIPWIDAHYHTIKSRSGRAITGLSMGGHGAFFLALRHQDLFGAAGSMSGGLDIRPFPKNWDLAKRLGTYEEHPENWEKYTVTNMLDLLQNGSLALIMDCGVDDFFFKVNEEFHQKLMQRKIAHDFIVRPGEHNWDYWANAVQYQLLFMHHFFQQ